MSLTLPPLDIVSICIIFTFFGKTRTYIIFVHLLNGLDESNNEDARSAVFVCAAKSKPYTLSHSLRRPAPPTDGEAASVSPVVCPRCARRSRCSSRPLTPTPLLPHTPRCPLGAQTPTPLLPPPGALWGARIARHVTCDPLFALVCFVSRRE